MTITYQTLDPQGRQGIQCTPRFIDLRHSPSTTRAFINALETDITAGAANGTATHGIRVLCASLMLSTDVSGQIVLPLACFASPFCILASRVRTEQVIRLRRVCGVLRDDVAVKVSLLTKSFVTLRVWALVGREVNSEVSTW